MRIETRYCSDADGFCFDTPEKAIEHDKNLPRSIETYRDDLACLEKEGADQDRITSQKAAIRDLEERWGAAQRSWAHVTYDPAYMAPRTTQERRAWRQACKQWPDHMALVHIWPENRILPSGTECISAWRSRRFLATLWRETNGHERLTINRVEINTATGAWKEGIGWETLQRIKRECGLGERACIEIYPPDSELVNDAPMRHLWLLNSPPDQMWTRAGNENLDEN